MQKTSRESLDAMLSPCVESFLPVSLEEMSRVLLMDRADTKFVMHVADLPSVLQEAREQYSVLEVAGNRNRRYKTIYFDSEDYKLYRMHHNGKLRRYKLRIRKYQDTGQTFLELKSKNPKRHTEKTRMRYYGSGEDSDPLAPFRSFCRHEAELLGKAKESLRVEFDRITLVHNSKPERITIDTGLTLSSGNEQKELLNLCILEVKQPRDGGSPFSRIMLRKKIFPLRISKYCLGMIMHHEDLKKNNFKPRMMRLQKIMNKYDLIT